MSKIGSITMVTIAMIIEASVIFKRGFLKFTARQQFTN